MDRPAELDRQKLENEIARTAGSSKPFLFLNEENVDDSSAALLK